MNAQKMPNLKLVNRIVINRTAVWEYIVPEPLTEKEQEQFNDDSPFWKKVAGGLGFNPDIVGKSGFKDEHQMTRLIHKRLIRKMRTLRFENQDLELFTEEHAYKWWISGKTLNLVRKDLQKTEPPKCPT
jgi:hypothetical protein